MMPTDDDLIARLGRDHAELVAGFAAATLPAHVARRTRWCAFRKTIVLLASASAGMFVTVIATHSLAVQAAASALSTPWASVIALCIALGALTVFALLFAREPG
jgi:hypothetical protein